MTAKTGDVINKIAIRAVFDAYFDQIIVPSHLQAIPRIDRKAPPTYQVKQPLPTQAEYRSLRTTRFTTTVGDLISSAQGTVEDLGSELRSWHDNLPDGLNSSAKADEIEEAASTLENLSFPDVPDSVSDLPVVHIPALEQDSRPKRSAEATSKLENAIEALNARAEELRQELTDAEEVEADGTEAVTTDAEASASESQDPTADHQETIEEIESLVTELENAKSELEDVSYPAMR